MNNCVLCSSVITSPELIIKNDTRKYHICDECHLIQVKKDFYPSKMEAEKRYLQHKKDAGSNGHITHLRKALQPSAIYIHAADECLDYGCGPVPVLSEIIIREMSAGCDFYDPYFGFTIPEKKQYDHIFCLETAEHFLNPKSEFDNIFNRLRPGGHVILMTERYRDLLFFADWYYRRDFTHVVFFHQNTLLYIEQKYEFNRVYDDGKSVSIFRKSKFENN
jgi:hypothetical protein